MTLVESPVLWQCLLSALAGYTVAHFVHGLFRVSADILKSLSA